MDRGAAPDPWPGRREVVGGRALFVRETPATNSRTAEPAVYVHGLGGSSLNWTDFAGLLADRVAGHAVDLPGFGQSPPPDRYTVAGLADRVTAWLEYTDRGPVHLFGNSFGGAVAVRIAATRPELVRTLTLISPALPFLNPRRSAHGRFVPLLLVPRVEWLAARRLASIGPEALAREMIELCFADPSRIPPRRLAEGVAEIRRRLTLPWVVQAQVRTFRHLVGAFLRAYLPGAGSLWRLAGRITAPTLIIWGRADRLVDARLAPRVAAAIPGSRLLLLDGVGHVPQMEVPDVVAEAVTGFLDDARAPVPAPASPRA